MVLFSKIGRYLLCRLSISLLYCSSAACNLLVLSATQCVCLCIEECVPVNSGRKGTRKTTLKTTTCFSFFVYIVIFGMVSVCVWKICIYWLSHHTTCQSFLQQHWLLLCWWVFKRVRRNYEGVGRWWHVLIYC